MPHLCFPLETSTNLWPPSDWQYEGKRANHLLSVSLFFFSPSYVSNSTALRRLSLPPPAPRWKTLNLELSSHQLQNTLPRSSRFPHETPPFFLSPPLHLSSLSIWCCLSSCQYLCPIFPYHLAAATSICEAAPVSAPLMMLPHALTTLFVWCQYRTVPSLWCWLGWRSSMSPPVGVCVRVTSNTESQQKTGFLRFLSPVEKHIYIVGGACCHLMLVCRYNTVFYSWAGRHGNSFHRFVWKIGYIDSVVFNQ